MGQTRPLFVYFRPFHMTNIAQILQMKKRRWHAWARTQGGRMVGADESTELWRHPKELSLKTQTTTQFSLQNLDLQKTQPLGRTIIAGY